MDQNVSSVASVKHERTQKGVVGCAWCEKYSSQQGNGMKENEHSMSITVPFAVV